MHYHFIYSDAAPKTTYFVDEAVVVIHEVYTFKEGIVTLFKIMFIVKLITTPKN